MRKARLGPIDYGDRLVSIEDPPARGRVAGLVGNEVLSRCAAVVFDFPNRTLWLEPPCDRKEPESLAAWQLVRAKDGDKNTPWVVETVTPGGSAADAGIQAGDRLVSIGGVTAGPDLAQLLAAVKRPAGAVVDVSIQRGPDKKHVPMRLHELLPLAPSPAASK
ncbi:MAG TPA: PDZ domain-containing protein [Minicystis sp.]|nr:PDZ domain-containing protein [Minicystis sp.]